MGFAGHFFMKTNAMEDHCYYGKLAVFVVVTAVSAATKHSWRELPALLCTYLITVS